MNFFVCDECLCIESTALGAYNLWEMGEVDRALCSSCSKHPDAPGGWHGEFELRVASAEELWQRRAEFVSTLGLRRVLLAKVDPAILASVLAQLWLHAELATRVLDGSAAEGVLEGGERVQLDQETYLKATRVAALSELQKGLDGLSMVKLEDVFGDAGSKA